MRKLITLLSLALCIGMLHGQISMFVHQNNSSADSYNIDDLRKITFDSGMNVHPYTGTVSNYAIDDVYKITFQPGVFTALQTPESPTSSMITYPNPSSDQINVEYNLNDQSDVDLTVYNIKGDLIKLIDLGSMSEGTHTFQLDLSQNNLSPGIYVVHLRTNSSVQTNKVIIR